MTRNLRDTSKSYGPSDPEVVRQIYDKGAGGYDQSRLRTAYQRRFDSTERQFLRRYLPQVDSVLEVGAGTGRLTNELLAKASAVTAVDISEEMLTRVRAKYPDAGKLHLFQGDAHRLDQVTGYGSFDAVVSMRMLPHIEDIVGVLRLLCAAVKPGGFVIADFWNPRSYTYWRKRGSSVYNHYVPYDEARAMLLRAGLEILAIEGAGFQSPIDLNLEFLGRTPLKRFGYSLIAVCRRPC